MPNPVDVAGLLAGARAGQPRAVARLVSLVEDGLVEDGLVEDGHPALREVTAGIAADGGRARLVGITGAPGVGKSTVTSALVAALRRTGVRVGVLAVDPSSPFTGGALLGDRIRMQGHATDPGVFIRSMATRGQLGGLARAVPQAARVLSTAGYGTVLIETVGVGQSEVEVATLADTTVVLLAPGMGDGVQAAKAGILEVGDVFVVNKADRDGAELTVRELRHTIGLGERREPGQWRPPVLSSVATTGQGVDGLLAALADHQAWALAGGEFDRRRVRRARTEIEAISLAEVRRRFGTVPDAAGLAELATQVAAGRLDPYTAADRLLDAAGR